MTPNAFDPQRHSLVLVQTVFPSLDASQIEHHLNAFIMLDAHATGEVSVEEIGRALVADGTASDEAVVARLASELGVGRSETETGRAGKEGEGGQAVRVTLNLYGYFTLLAKM